jgi:hypothetical protein
MSVRERVQASISWAGDVIVKKTKLVCDSIFIAVTRVVQAVRNVFNVADEALADKGPVLTDAEAKPEAISKKLKGAAYDLAADSNASRPPVTI